ncbi:MAG: hypothetical protein WCF18_23495, partial [Chthoniobacteraceae bacterium]
MKAAGAVFGYCKAKLLGSVYSLIPLAIAPFLWGLLAFNGLLTTSNLGNQPVIPLATSSLTIVQLRFIGIILLSTVATVVILVFLRTPVRVSWGPFWTALKRYLQLNFGTYFRTVLFGGVLALPAFFLSFDYIGVVLTNLIAGLCPAFELFFDWLRRHPSIERKLRPLFGERAAPAEITGSRILEIALLLLTLSLLLLLTFDTVNPTLWPKTLLKANPHLNFNLGAFLAMGSALFWMLYLTATSRWPAYQSRNRDSRTFTLAQHYASAAGQMQPPQIDRLNGPFGWIETFLVKLALVQLGALALNLAWMSVAAAAGWLEPGLKQVAVVGTLVDYATKVLSDLGAMSGRLRHLDGTRGITLLGIILGPSFGAYVLIGHFTQKYEEKRKNLHLTVPGSTWNALFSFLEPLVATIVGI